jgi:hypothetical protein
LSGAATGVLNKLAERGAARAIDCANESAFHLMLP